MTEQRNKPAVNAERRLFLGTIACGSATFALSQAALAQGAGAESADTRSARANDSQPVDVAFRVNGTQRHLRVDARMTLLDALRGPLGLTGAKKGCDRGQCGACTVLVNGRRINACLTLAVMHDGDAITTVEGLATDEQPSTIQAAFLAHDAYQCGFCTPGQLCAATALADELRCFRLCAVSSLLCNTAKVEVTDAEIRERMSGNLCRCGAYASIVAAVRDALDSEKSSNAAARE